jgi:hypothetical protein
MFALDQANIAITQQVAAFFGFINLIQSNLNTIDTLRFVLDMPITGITVSRKNMRGAVTVVTINIMKATYSYATDPTVNNPQLAAQMKISASRLNRMTYKSLVQFIGGAILIVSPLATAGTLQNYNVTAAMVTAWQTLLTQLQSMLAGTTNAIATREALLIQVYNLLRDSMVILTNNCDELVFQFRNIDMTYFNSYWANRHLNQHHVSTQLRAHVQSELDQPVTAEVFIDGTDISGFTDPTTGYLLLTGIPFGPHTVTIVTGTNSKTFGPFDFKKGHSLTEHFIVAPAFAEPAKTITDNTETTVQK